MRPYHGAAVVKEILSNARARAAWEEELAVMREREKSLRALIVSTLRRETNSNDYDFIEHQRGIFALLALTPEQVDPLGKDTRFILSTVAGSILPVSQNPNLTVFWAQLWKSNTRLPHRSIRCLSVP